LNFKQIVERIRTQGFCHEPGAVSADIVAGLRQEILVMEEKDYNVENLARNAVYISDSGPTRVSHAMMVSADGLSLFPEVPVRGPAVGALVVAHNQILSDLVEAPVSPSSRVMFNFQRYFGESKPVAEHFDGHYIDYTKVSPTEFKLHIGLLPRYVVVVTLENQNTEGQVGTVLRDCRTNEVFCPPSAAGDLLIFDNLRFRHSVPKLTKPRLMVGMRCFDSSPVLFYDDKAAVDGQVSTEDGWSVLEDAVNPGIIRGLSDPEAQGILSSYYGYVWPRHWKQIQEEGALF
jgi:hypothetical protein